MKRKCINCKHYDNGYRSYGENGYDFDNASCRLGIKNANYFDENEEQDFFCTLSQKEFDLRTKLANLEYETYYNGWEACGLKYDIKYYKGQIEKLKSEQNKVAVEKLEELLKESSVEYHLCDSVGGKYKCSIYAVNDIFIKELIQELKGKNL